jgi:amino acid transporter
VRSAGSVPVRHGTPAAVTCIDVSTVTGSAKRLLFGRALRSDRLGETLLPKRLALPVFASDALSSVAYATEEILLVLSLGGLAYFVYAPWVGIGVALLMTVVVASYRQNVRAYPSGGGDYEVATTNLGPNAGLTVASALLVDYVMTVAVSISSAVANIGSAFPAVSQHAVPVAVVLIAVISIMNLRGVRESGTAFAIPTYAFMFGIFSMIIWAAVRLLHGDTLAASSSTYTIVAERQALTGLALMFLVLRAFSSGCTALTGVEAISNGVPAFRKPKSKNAATTLLMLGVLSVTMFLSITVLALVTHVRVAENASDLVGLPAGQAQKTVISQVAQAVFANFPPGYIFISVMTALILVLAANTAFNGFPVLGAILAQDRYLPRQLHTRGDRLAFSNGIIMLAGLAMLLVVTFQADVTHLIQLYIVGVFVSFTLSQLGMIRHWNRHLRSETDPAARGRMFRSRIVNSIGFVMTGSVLIIVILTKFLGGAWIVVIAMPVLFWLMKSIRKHYDRVALELAPDEDEAVMLPSRVHAIVLVSRIHRPTLRALSFARATRPSTLEAVTVNVDEADTEALTQEWQRRRIPVSLKVLDSPYREVTRPILDYVKGLRRSSPRDLVIIYIPEYVVGRWWEQLLHNQSALRLKTRLLFLKGVMVTNVPWQMESSQRVSSKPLENAAGAVRRGEPAVEIQSAVVERSYDRDPSEPAPIPAARDDRSWR